MSDGILKNREEGSRNGMMIPVAVEIIAIFVLLIFLGGLAVHFTLEKEFLEYESSMYRLSMEQLMEAEAQRLFSAEEFSGGKPVDIQALEKNGGRAEAGDEIEFTGDLAFCYSPLERRKRRENISLRYVFSDRDRTLTELDLDSEQIRRITLQSEYGEAVRRVIQNGRTEEVTHGTGSAKYRMRLCPLKVKVPLLFGKTLLSRGGSTSGVVLCAYYYESNQLTSSRRREMMITVAALAGLFIAAAAVSAMVYFSLKVFKPIRASMEAIRRGEVEKAEEEGRKFRELISTPEVSELQDNVQLMFLSIREYTANVNTIMKDYDPVLPMALLKQFGKEDIREICPGDRAVLKGLVLMIGLENDPAEKNILFRERNRLIGTAADTVQLLGGIVFAMGYERIRAVFPEPLEHTAQEIIEALRNLKTDGTGVKRIRVSLSVGTTVLSVIGVPERMAIRQDQESSELLSEMDRIQGKYQLEPLYTGPEEEKPEPSRKLWTLSGGREVIELLNGNGDSAVKKRETKELWDKAAECRLRKKFREAVELFGEVLRLDPGDGAAGCLLEECEKEKEAPAGK